MGNRALDRRIEEQNRKKNQKAPPPPEELEEELAQPAFVPLNRKKSAFDGAGAAGGIDTALSVFDRQAVFQTGGEE